MPAGTCGANVTCLTPEGSADTRRRDAGHRSRAAPGLGSNHVHRFGDFRPADHTGFWEAVMTKLTIAATALFLASTGLSHAGNSISFQIEGQKIRIETPRNCGSLNCVT